MQTFFSDQMISNIFTFLELMYCSSRVLVEEFASLTFIQSREPGRDVREPTGILGLRAKTPVMSLTEHVQTRAHPSSFPLLINNPSTCLNMHTS